MPRRAGPRAPRKLDGGSPGRVHPTQVWHTRDVRRQNLNSASNADRASPGLLLSASLANSWAVLEVKSGHSLRVLFLRTLAGISSKRRHSQRTEVSKEMQLEQEWRSAPQRAQVASKGTSSKSGCFSPHLA